MNQQAQSLLANAGIAQMNDMQLAVFAAATHQKNIILLSATGSGKSYAFLLPVLLRILQQPQSTNQCLVLAPSRELALQLEDVAKKLQSGVSITCCYGGHKREIEENNLLANPQLIIGTPGRLADHLRRGNINPATIHSVVLDEYDKMVELGFQAEMETILEQLTAVDFRMLTSATEADALPKFLSHIHFETINFLSDSEGPRISFHAITSPYKDKLASLYQLICSLGDKLSIVFLNHRDAVGRTYDYLVEQGIAATYYHGAMDQREREYALAKFRNRSANVLVTTDLAARGLDIPHIYAIVHYHLPHDAETFTHRNGRTARVDAAGKSILIVGPDERLPDFTPADVTEYHLPENVANPVRADWKTIIVEFGKKDKINKVDLVGFFLQQCDLKKDDLGVIEVKDFTSFVAVRAKHAKRIINSSKELRIKGKKMKMSLGE